MIVTWLGEQITDKGLRKWRFHDHLCSIVSAIPDMIKGIYGTFVNILVNTAASSHFCRIYDCDLLIIYHFTTTDTAG